MKIPPRNSSSLLSLCYLYSLSLAALFLVDPHGANGTIITNLTSGTPSPITDPPPLDPLQRRVANTPTTLIFGKYSPPVPDLTMTTIIERAQYEIIHSIINAQGDKLIAQPTFEWRHGRVYVRIEQQQLEVMRWSTMAEALHGVVDFGHSYGFLGCRFTILNDKDGVVGSGSVGVGYT